MKKLFVGLTILMILGISSNLVFADPHPVPVEPFEMLVFDVELNK